MSKRLVVIREAWNGFHLLSFRQADFGERSDLYNSTDIDQVYKMDEYEQMLKDISRYLDMEERTAV